MCVISFCYNKLKSLNIKKFNPIFPSPKIRKRQNIALTPTVCPHQKEKGEKSVFVGFFLFFCIYVSTNGLYSQLFRKRKAFKTKGSFSTLAKR